MRQGEGAKAGSGGARGGRQSDIGGAAGTGYSAGVSRKGTEGRATGDDAAFGELRDAIRSCTLCADRLPFGSRPVFQVSRTSRVLIAGQAPGRRVHETGIPFNDPSGDRLRDWLGLDREVFYDASRVALVPMGFCYPGTGESGDLPPRPECAAAWRERLLRELGFVSVTLAVGQYAIGWHLGARAKSTLTETVRAWREYAPGCWPIPHPSPRNNLWLRRNPWFESDVVPELRRRIAAVLFPPSAREGRSADSGPAGKSREPGFLRGGSAIGSRTKTQIPTDKTP